jgi:type I restriction enzyme R subunit
LQQAKDNAELLGLKFAYATNGHGIVEFDYASGKERPLEAFPTPDELWRRLKSAENITNDETAGKLLASANASVGKGQRYYQEIAINHAMQAILQRKKRVLLTMATGTGKTAVAYQICWKLWNMRWNRACEQKSFILRTETF